MTPDYDEIDELIASTNPKVNLRPAPQSCKHEVWIRSEPDTPADYKKCATCGTLRSLKADPSIYARADYWSEKSGHSSLYHQAYNVDLHTENGVSKSRFILDRIASDRGAALEIGCAPGRMLYWLKWAARFKNVVGVDAADRVVIKHVSSDSGVVLTGMFPQVTSVAYAEPGCIFDYMLASDVFEHSVEPIAFLAECSRLLKPGGQLFLMLPFANGLPLDSRMFNAIEHAFLHSRRNMVAMMEDAGFERLQVDCWCLGHDTITGFKK